MVVGWPSRHLAGRSTTETGRLTNYFFYSEKVISAPVSGAQRALCRHGMTQFPTNVYWHFFFFKQNRDNVIQQFVLCTTKCKSSVVHHKNKTEMRSADTHMHCIF